MGAEGVDVRLVIPPADTAVPTATPSAPVPPPPPTSPIALPRTGVELLGALLIAVLLLAIGALLLKAGHVRRRPV